MKTAVKRNEAFGGFCGDIRQVFICACNDPRHSADLYYEDEDNFVSVELSLPHCAAHWKDRLKMLWRLFLGHYRGEGFLLLNEDIDAFCAFLQESKKRCEIQGKKESTKCPSP